MKNPCVLICLVLGLVIPFSSKADISSTLEGVASAAEYLIGYGGSIDKLNTLAAGLRTSLKAWYKVKSLVGFGSYDDLKKGFLLPPTPAVPDQVLDQLKQFNTIQVGTVEVPGYVEEHSLRAATTELGIFETQFVQRRLAHVRNTLSTAQPGVHALSPDCTSNEPYAYALARGLSTNANVPRIAVCYSGGGFRAMVGTLGFWKALSDTGMVNSILYTANLSGSTWCSMPWSMGFSLQELQDIYEANAKVSVGLSTVADLMATVKPNLNTDYVKQKFTAAFLWEQPLSSIRGLYGPLLGEMTLRSPEKKQSPQYMYLWQAKEYMAQNPAGRPFPIATALVPYEGTFSKSVSVISREQQQKNGLWMEFNPEYVGFEYLDDKKQSQGAWIPSFALGRTFEAVNDSNQSLASRIFSGKKVIGYAGSPSPCQTVDYWEGTWGSAFTVSPGDIYRIFFGTKFEESTDEKVDFKDTTSLSNRLIGYLGSTITLPITGSTVNNLKNVRLFPAKFNNFAVFPESPFASATTLTAVDGGIDFNLPFPPLLRTARGIDLIIVGDFSEQGTPPAKELLLAERWAIARGVPFPMIAKSSQYAGVATRPMTLFNEFGNVIINGKSVRLTGPAILYVPIINNGFNQSGFSIDECFKAACSTFNFDYRNRLDMNNSYIKQLSDWAYRTVWGVYPQMREVVQNLVDAKNAGDPFKMTKLSSLDDLIDHGLLYGQ